MANKLIRLTESDLHRIVKESVQKILREMDDKPMPATKNTNWLADDEFYSDNKEVPRKHTGEYSYPTYDIPNNYKDYYGFDEDGLNGKTNHALSSDDSPEDAWNFNDEKQFVIHRGNERGDDLPYVKRKENPNHVIPNDEIYKRIGNPSQYKTYRYGKKD